MTCGSCGLHFKADEQQREYDIEELKALTIFWKAEADRAVTQQDELLAALEQALASFMELGACEKRYCQHINPECEGAETVRAAIRAAIARTKEEKA